MLQQIFSEPFGKLSGIMTERNSLSVKEIPLLFLLSLIVGRFNIFPVPEAYVLRVTFDFPPNFNASRQSCLFFLTVSQEPHFRVVEQQILVVPLTMMSWLFQLFLRTYLMPSLDLSLPMKCYGSEGNPSQNTVRPCKPKTQCKESSDIP